MDGYVIKQVGSNGHRKIQMACIFPFTAIFFWFFSLFETFHNKMLEEKCGDGGMMVQNLINPYDFDFLSQLVMCSLSLAKFRRVHLQNTFTRPAAIQSSSCGMSLLSQMLISFGRDQVIPIFSFCLWIHTEHRVNFQILQFYQDWLENWLPQCISYYVNKPDSGNEVTDPFISHLGVALFSSFLLVSVIS